MGKSSSEMNFGQLVDSIHSINTQLANQARRAVNVSLTLRNWLIGYYISEYQLHGADRANYGDKTISVLAEKLKDISNCSRQELYRYLDFCRIYPQIVGTLSLQLNFELPVPLPKQKVGTLSGQLEVPVKELVLRLSYSHFNLLIGVEDQTARVFYEIECMKGNWSVRELKRQIGSLYYERMGLSINKKKLSQMTQNKAESDQLALTIRDPYVFEFLGLNPKETMNESMLEDQLIDKLEEFLLEMGHGFCFEARQKRILIGDEFYFIDVVFYNRILKCHVLVEIKAGPFSHGHISQLNTYVNYYRKNEMTQGDNPPIGILLCTGKNNALVEYALAGMDQRLFVSKYQLELPSKEVMEDFIRKQLGESI